MTISCHAYYSVRTRLGPLLTAASKPQRENLCLLTFGLFTAGHAQLTRIAARLPLPIKVASARQRLERLMKNQRLDPARVYAPIAQLLLGRFAGARLRLILDGTQVNGQTFMLFVALAYRGRALPLAWLMLDQHSVSSAFAQQKQLLDRIARMLPAQTEVVLLGDREYATVALIGYCLEHGWHFVLRAKQNRVLLAADGKRQSVGAIAQAGGLTPGGRLYRTGLRLPELANRPINLVCGWSWQHPEDEPWLLLTDLPADARVIGLYRVRFHIDEMFRDFKEYGLRLETTRLKQADRVSRLLLGICLAYVWLLCTGVWLSKRGGRKQVDRRPQRQLCYFQIGWLYLLQQWARGNPLPCSLIAYV